MTISREEAIENFRRQQRINRAKSKWNMKMKQQIERINAERRRKGY